MKRILIMFFILSLIFTTMTVTFADASKSDSLNKIIVKPESDVSGEDYWTASRTYLTTGRRFVKYLTSSWAPTDGYTWTNSVTYGWSVTSGIDASYSIVKAVFSWTLSRTESYSVAIHIPADPSRLSKLGFYADFNYYSVTAKLHDWWSGAINDIETGTAYNPTTNTYLLVVYQ